MHPDSTQSKNAEEPVRGACFLTTHCYFCVFMNLLRSEWHLWGTNARAFSEVTEARDTALSRDDKAFG